MSAWTRLRDKVTGGVKKIGGSGLLGPMGIGLSNAANVVSPDSPGVDPNSPSSIYAGMTREWWADQQARYFPLEDMTTENLLDPAKRQALRSEGLAATTKAVDNSFNRAGNRLETLRSRTNQSQSARNAESASRLDAVTKTATTVTARNSARQFMDETENAVLGG